MHDRKFVDLKFYDWQKVINITKESGLRHSSQKKIKNMVGQLYKFSNKNELTNRNYAQLMELDKNMPLYTKEPFSVSEIKILWENKDEYFVDLILILIYTGVRISELLRLKGSEDVFINDRYFIVRESKTEAGRNRLVPINKKIKLFIQPRLCSEYLVVSKNGGKMSYGSFANRFKKVMKRYGMNHTIHECRHTCATLLDNAGANDLAVRRILGHAANNITGKIYVHKNIKDLIKAIDLI